MSIKITEFLDSVESLETSEESDPNIQLEGHLMRSDENTVRLICTDLSLSFPVEDVLAVREMDTGNVAQLAMATPVSVSLICGARLIESSPAAIYASLVTTPQLPFAYAVRTTLPPMHESPQFRTLEAAFRTQHGL